MDWLIVSITQPAREPRGGVDGVASAGHRLHRVDGVERTPTAAGRTAGRDAGTAINTPMPPETLTMPAPQAA